MLLIQLGKRTQDCRVEFDGKDISKLVVGVELRAFVGQALTEVRITLLDEVVIMGEAGRVEFVKRIKP
jgi:hypothetical protein